MGIWLVPQDELTVDQLRGVQLPIDGHKLIYGPPGSGKTLALVHRARHLFDRYGIAPDRLRLFVYTRSLRDYILSALNLLRIPSECILGFDAWCRSYYTQHIAARVPWDSNNRTPDFAAIRKEVLSSLESGNDAVKYDCVLVDEGHDLDDISFRILQKIGRHVTVCMDSKQQIYDSGITEGEVLAILGLRNRSVSLLEAYRCCPYIVKLAATFLQDDKERQYYLAQTKVVQGEREKPLLAVARSQPEELALLVDKLGTRQLLGDRIAILFPSRRQVYGYANALREAGFEVEVPKEFGGKGSKYIPLDFNSDLPKLMPYHSAKGLTFDTIFMPRLLDSCFRHSSDERIRSLLFVGITRATKWVYIGTDESQILPQLKMLFAPSSSEYLSVQYARNVGGATMAEDDGEEETEVDDDLSNLFS